MTVERYSHVMHLTSEVSGELLEGRGPVDVLRATLPAGTVSGAPKVRAMEIIDELEPTKRGPYAGVVGYIDFSGNLDTAIAIRTLVVSADGKASVQAGAGIVADSDPAAEDEECAAKAAAVLAAVAGARQLAAGAAQAVSTPGAVGLVESYVAHPRRRLRTRDRTRRRARAGPRRPQLAPGTAQPGPGTARAGRVGRDARCSRPRARWRPTAVRRCSRTMSSCSTPRAAAARLSSSGSGASACG